MFLKKYNVIIFINELIVRTLVFTFLQLKAIILRGFWFSTTLSAISDLLVSLPILKNPVNLIYSYSMVFDGVQLNVSIFGRFLNIDNPYFEGMVNQINPSELQLNKANTSDTDAPFLDLHLSISYGFVSSKIYDKRDDFDFDIVNFPFLDGDVPRRPSYGVYISQLIRFARVCSHVDDFNTRNKCLTAKLLKQGYRYHKLRKAFSKFYRRHYELISKFNVGLKSFFHKAYRNQNFMVT